MRKTYGSFLGTILYSLFTIALISVDAYAINKCTDKSGKVSYQEEPCPDSMSSKQIKIQGKTKDYKVLVPSLGWGLGFTAPRLQVLKDSDHPKRYHYEASSSNGFVASIFVEPAAGKGNSSQSCGHFYWQKTAQNPMIMPKSVERVDANDFIIVMYVINAIVKGTELYQVNYNLYGYKQDKCVDVHVSQVFNDVKKLSFEQLKQFALSLHYVES